MAKYRKINDFWSAYAYGDKIKLVYIKSAFRRLKKVDKLFPELDGLPNRLLPYAIHSTIYGGNVVDEVALPSEQTVVSSRERQDTEERLAPSISRTKSRIFELAMCNEFSFFCTFTTSEKKVKDRYNLEEFQKSFAQFIRNLNRKRDKKIVYLLIPEKHKDGAWHLHGLIEGLEIGTDLREFSLEEHLPYRLRTMLINGEKVYNWDKYSNKYGYFTASKIRNKDAVSAYICKYITKDLAKKVRESGQHLYFASQGLKRRELLFRNGLDGVNNLVDFKLYNLRESWDSVSKDGTIKVCNKPNADEWWFENEFVKIKWFDNITEFGNILLSQKRDTKK